MVRGLKFRIKKVDGLYYPCSETKGADELRGYREADLLLCFGICKKKRFSHDEAQIFPTRSDKVTDSATDEATYKASKFWKREIIPCRQRKIKLVI